MSTEHDPTAADGRSRRAARMKKATRAHILESARETFADKGYQAVSIADLLSAASVARGTFYAHFESKGDVLTAVLRSFLDELADTIEPVVVGAARSITQQLADNFTRIIAILTDHGDLTELLLKHAPGAGPDVQTSIDLFYEGVREMVMRSLRSGVAMGLVPDGPIPLRASFVLGAIKEAVTETMLGGEGAPDAELVVRELLSFVLHGFLGGRAATTL